MKKIILYTSLISLGWLAIIYPRMLVPPLLPFIKNEFNITYTEVSLLMSAYLFSYGIMQLPSGLLCDKYGYKYLMIFSMLGSSITSFLTSFLYSFTDILLIRFVAGLLSGAWYTSSTLFLLSNLSSSELGYGLGLSFNGSSLANILIYATLYLLASYVEKWRFLFLLASFPGLINAFLILALIKKHTSTNSETKREFSYKLVFKFINKKILFILLLNIVVSFSMWGTQTYIPSYLILEKELNPDYVYALLMMQSIASIFGNISIGYMINKLGINISLLIILITSNLSLFSIQFIDVNWLLALLLFVSSFFGNWFICMSLLILDAAPSNLKGTFLGLFNTITFFMGTISSPLFGYVLDFGGFSWFFMIFFLLFIASIIVYGFLIKLDAPTRPT